MRTKEVHINELETRCGLTHVHIVLVYSVNECERQRNVHRVIPTQSCSVCRHYLPNAIWGEKYYNKLKIEKPTDVMEINKVGLR